MSSLNEKKNNEKNQISIRLKPIFGIQPLAYVPVCVLSVLFGIVFFLCVYPGLVSYGSHLYIESFPKKAAIFINDELVGSTPYKVFTTAGNTAIRLEKPHYNTHITQIQIKGRRFFSLFFPKKYRYSVSLPLTSLENLLKESYYNASSWYALSEDRVYKRAPIILDTINSLLQTQNLTSHENWKHQIDTWIFALRDLIRDQNSWKDITQAWVLLEQSALAISIPKSLDKIRLSSSFTEVIQKFVEQNTNSLSDSKSDQTSFLKKPLSEILGLTFKTAHSSIVLMGNLEKTEPEYFANLVLIPSFYYLNNYFSISEYHKLTQDYTVSVDSSPYTSIPYSKINTVLNKINAELEKQGYLNLKAKLPSEAEWQYLAENRYIQPRYFEWTRDNYIPYRGLYYPKIADFPQPFTTREKVIRGRSDFSEDLPLWTRIGFPIDEDLQNIAFRIVIVEKNDS